VTNPQGHSFDLVLFKKAGCKGVGAWHEFASWFPGYSWRICVCAKCGAHLGWLFEPFDDKEDRAFVEKPSHLGFYALILDKVIDESRE